MKTVEKKGVNAAGRCAAGRMLACWLAVAALLAMGCRGALGETLTLSFVGDCSLGEAIQFKGDEEGYTWMLDQKGMDWPFSLVCDLLQSDDFTFANLEVVFTERTKHEDKRLPLVAEPRYAQALAHSGIDAVNTVNNHCFDFRVEGYLDTIKTLDELDFQHFGTTHVNNSKYEQDVLLTAEVKGVKIGALGFTYPQDKDLRHIESRIDRLRDEGCELVIVSLHWGEETQDRQNAWQMQFARKVIRAGADVIWGHHAHVLQPVQFYMGKPILYSTGNFTFGSMSDSVDRDTGIFQLVYSTEAKSMVEFRVIPCRTTGKGDYRPYVLTEPEDRARVWKKLIDPKSAAENVQNLPQRFAETGQVSIQNGKLVE